MYVWLLQGYEWSSVVAALVDTHPQNKLLP